MAKTVKGPDGKPYVFPDDATDAEIISFMETQGAPVPSTVSGPSHPLDTFGKMAIDAGVGAAKGLGRSAVGLGRLVRDVTPFTEAISPDAESELGLDPTSGPQSAGMALERILEFFAPGGAPKTAATTLAVHAAPFIGKAAPMVARAAAEAIPAAVVTGAQGGDPLTGGLIGAASVPGGEVVAKGVRAAGEFVGSKAVPLVRAAIKPTVTAMKQTVGAAYTGIESQANKLSRFIIDNGITTSEKAERIIQESEKSLRALFASGANAITDAPQRAMRYLNALERSAAKQSLPADDVATIKAAAKEMLDKSSMGEDVTNTVMKKGKPVQVKSRALRTDVMADEALDSARANSKWDTRKQWGEQKGAKMEASKTIERAQRDSVKAAVPESAPILQRQGMGIQTKKVLDRSEFRQANRDALSLPAHVVAAGEIARGKVPVLAAAANWLRNNQMKAGIWADRMAKAIERKDVEGAAEILRRFGVSAADAQPATSGR